jgi:hypothetical protein
LVEHSQYPELLPVNPCALPYVVFGVAVPTTLNGNPCAKSVHTVAEVLCDFVFVASKHNVNWSVGILGE